MPDLTKSIQNLYKGEISQGEAEIAKNNLVSFFRTLQQIEERQSQHKGNITQNVNNEVIKNYANNRNSN
jgi:hypothetical protein